MRYRFAKERQDYSDYASGRVFYNFPGHPAFPVRLTSEIFQRCVAFRKTSGITDPCVIYDPCCGGAYHLGTLAYLHWYAISEIIGSDADPEALSLAERNLALLTVDGLDRRMTEISEMLASFKKPSHAAALESAKTLRHRLLKLLETHRVTTRLFQADATDSRSLRDKLHGTRVDVIITDVPYGWRSAWQFSAPAHEAPLGPIWQTLEALLPVLAVQSVVAVAADKRQKIAHEAYRRIERFRVGKRQVALLQPMRSNVE